MVTAILQNLKLSTRRTRGLKQINENPGDWQFEWSEHWVQASADRFVFTQKSTITAKSLEDKSFYQAQLKCPFGKIGHVLWVRETFCPMVISDFDGNGNDKHTWLYKTEPNADDILNQMEDATWKPSIHMPKAAARIWLEVTGIEAERLHDITDDDIIAEGVRIPVNGIGTGKVLLALGE